MTAFVLVRRLALAALCSSPAAAQVVACPSSVAVPYFGWDATDCGKCNVYGSYIEYLTPPQIRDIKPGGPAAGRLRDNDVLIAVDGLEITTPAAWHRMRDVEPGDALRFSVRRGADTATATVTPATRCAAPSDPRISKLGRETMTVGNAVVEISGHPQSVTYDAKAGEAIIVAGGVIVRVKAKP